MSNLAQLQQQFVAFLQGQNASFEQLVAQQPPVTTETRLGIYKNAYHMRLRETIDSDHPILGTYLGDDLYDTLVDKYIALYPSKVKSLRYFCDAIPRILTEIEPFSQYPILSTLAAFERSLLSAFDAKDQAAIAIAQLANMPAQHWPTLTLEFHPSVRIFEQKVNAVQTWQALKGQQAPPAPTENELTDFWLIWRNQERLTEFRHLSAPELVFIRHFQQGGDFQDGCELLTEYIALDQVPSQAIAYLQNWILAGSITHLN